MPVPTIELKYRIRVYDSLTRRDFELALPAEHPVVTIYVCGMTTYDYPHVGSMRGPVFFDVVRRFLTAAGYDVIYVVKHALDTGARTYKDIVSALRTKVDFVGLQGRESFDQRGWRKECSFEIVEWDSKELAFKPKK